MIFFKTEFLLKINIQTKQMVIKKHYEYKPIFVMLLGFKALHSRLLHDDTISVRLRATALHVRPPGVETPGYSCVVPIGT